MKGYTVVAGTVHSLPHRHFAWQHIDIDRFSSQRPTRARRAPAFSPDRPASILFTGDDRKR